MSQQIICCVHDSKARVFCAPFFVAHLNVAQRAFAHEANNPNSQVGMYAGDFTLFEMGLFDDDLGTFNIYKVPVNHGLAVNYKEQRHVRKVTPQPLGNETLLQSGTEGGDSAIDV